MLAEVAAFVNEPMSGSGRAGAKLPPRGLLEQQVRQHIDPEQDGPGRRDHRRGAARAGERHRESLRTRPRSIP
jgi:hypothetical protein